jgi:hypothetical protein
MSTFLATSWKLIRNDHTLQSTSLRKIKARTAQYAKGRRVISRVYEIAGSSLWSHRKQGTYLHYFSHPQIKTSSIPLDEGTEGKHSTSL